MDELKKKAKNYFVLGLIAEKLKMKSEAATNLFKALFAIDDAAIFQKTGIEPEDHTDRFQLLKSNLPKLYSITDRLFSTYRRTYTKELNEEELELVKKRIKEAFDNAEITIPTDKEIKEKLKELLRKGKFFD